jgi:hypothetical protein
MKVKIVNSFPLLLPFRPEQLVHHPDHTKIPTHRAGLGLAVKAVSGG